jgi:hypothetical protein
MQRRKCCVSFSCIRKHCGHARVLRSIADGLKPRRMSARGSGYRLALAGLPLAHERAHALRDFPPQPADAPQIIETGGDTASYEVRDGLFSGFEPNPAPACSHCGEKPKLLRKMLNPQNGRTTRMFKCDCGEQTWSEDKE